MGATPHYLAIILARANAYSYASAMLRLSGTVPNFFYETAAQPSYPPKIVYLVHYCIFNIRTTI